MRIKLTQIFEQQAFGQKIIPTETPNPAFRSSATSIEDREIKKYKRELEPWEGSYLEKYSKGGPSTHPWYSKPDSISYKLWQNQTKKEKGLNPEAPSKQVTSTFENLLTVTEQSEIDQAKEIEELEKERNKRTDNIPDKDPVSIESPQLKLNQLLSIKKRLPQLVKNENKQKPLYRTVETERKL